MLADDDGGVGVLERRRTGEQLKCGGRQRILIGPPLDLSARQLFRCGVGYRANGHVGPSQTAGVVRPAGDPEVRQHNSFMAAVGIGDQQVGGLDVAVQQSALVGIVECFGDRRHDAHHLVRRHARWIPLGEQATGVGALDVVHRNPQLTLVFAAVVHLDDVRVPQRRGNIGFPVEPLAVLVVGTHRRRQHLERVAAREPRMLGQIHLTHPAGDERPQDRISRDHLAVR